MRITVNGQVCDYDEPLTLMGLLAHLSMLDIRIAVSLNGVVVNRACYEGAMLAAGDVIDIITAVGGG